MKVDPDPNTIELLVPLPNTLPVLLVPCVNVAPELKVIPLASAAVRLWAVDAVDENVIEPLTLPVDPVAILIVSTLVPLMFNDDPEAMSKQLLPPLRVKVLPDDDG
jgi:hypothetical protein